MVAIPVSGRLQRAGRTRRRAFGLRPVPSSSSRPFGVNPSRLPACGAARFACLQGIGARPIPAARCLAPLQERAEPAYAGSAWPAPRRNRLGAPDTPRLAAAGCANVCRPRRWRFSSIASRRMVHGHTARPSYGTSTPRLKTDTARCGRGFLVSRWSVDLARVRERVGETFVRGCRVGHNSFRSGSAQGVLVSL